MVRGSEQWAISRTRKCLRTTRSRLSTRGPKRAPPRGTPRTSPRRRMFADGWTIGKPDMIVTMPKDIDIPATGVLDQQNVLVHRAVRQGRVGESRGSAAGQREGVHHMKAWIRPPDSAWMKDAPEGVLYSPPRGAQDSTASRRSLRRFRRRAIGPCRTSWRNTTRASRARTSPRAMRRSSSPPDRTSCSRCTTRQRVSRRPIGHRSASSSPTVRRSQRHLTTTAISSRDFEIPAGAPNTK